MIYEDKKMHRVCLFNSAMQAKPKDREIAYIARDMLSGSGNVELLFREIASGGFADRFTHIIAVPRFDKQFKAFKESFPRLDIRFVAFDSDEFVKALASAKYLISDGRLPLYYIRRKGQKHLCLFNQNSLLFSEDEKGTFQSRIYKELSRLVPQTDFMLCANGEVLKIMNERLFLDSFYGGKLIRGAEPAYYGATAEKVSDAPAKSNAKYSPADIEKLMKIYAPAEEEETLPGNVIAPIPGEVPDRKTSLGNIIEALFFGESEFVGYPRSDRPKIAVTAYLNASTRYTLALRNFCDRIDKERYSVTVFAFATSSSAFCRGFGEGTRIIQRDDYTFSASDMEMQTADSDELSGKAVWKNEILRSLGSDNFDAVLVFNTVNPFRHRFAGYMNTGLRIFAAPGERELLEGYPDPAMLTELINRTYDRTLLLSGSGRRLKHTEKMPSVLWSGWKTAAEEHPEAVVFSDGERELIALTASPAAPVGCTLIPAVDKKCENTLCIAADMNDAKKISAAFAEYSAEKPSARLYLCVLTDSDEGAAALSSYKVTVLTGKKIPLLLMWECGRFVYPYEGGSGLETAAALLGKAARPREPEAKELLLMSGPEGGTLYSEYAPDLPAGGLITDSSVFEVQTSAKGLYDGFENNALEAINSLFGFERQE